jgi:hypothetical protein
MNEVSTPDNLDLLTTKSPSASLPTYDNIFEFMLSLEIFSAIFLPTPPADMTISPGFESLKTSGLTEEPWRSMFKPPITETKGCADLYCMEQRNKKLIILSHFFKA